MSMVSRIDAYQQRHRWVGLPLAVLYKFVDDQGSYLTAQITYYGFVSLFPLLLLLVTILSYALQGSTQLQREVLDSALAQFPVIGNQIATNIHSFHGSPLALAVGILGSVYGGLGIAQATQHALNKVWGVPRNSRPNPVKARLRSFLLLVAGGAAVVVTSALSALSAAANAYGASLGAFLRVVATVLAVALNVALFLVAFRVLTARSVAIRQIRGGAISAAIIWQALQWTGAFLIGDKLKGATATYGVFGLVLGLLLWIYLGALTVVICAEVNVVRAEQLWPRSLLTPFTDNVRLTPGDRRAYVSYPKTERHKGFERVDVDFDESRQPGPRTPES
jgi:YihY family inner membrane protein